METTLEGILKNCKKTQGIVYSKIYPTPTTVETQEIILSETDRIKSFKIKNCIAHIERSALTSSGSLISDLKEAGFKMLFHGFDIYIIQK